MASTHILSATPERPSTSASNNKKDGHQRAYQACTFCRQRKVRCDLGPVDNPHPPPCRRCKRENKECTFDVERRKKRPDEPDSPVEDGGRYVEPNKKARLDPPRRPSHLKDSSRSYSGNNVRSRADSPGGRSVISEDPIEEEEEDPQAEMQSTAVMQTGRIFSQNDALELLYKAAHHRTNSMSSAQPTTNGTTPQIPIASPHGMFGPLPAAQPGITFTSALAKEAAMQVWYRSRFVRSGWFTAEEGVSYVDYYFKNLHPLTPIAIPNYQDPATHQDLLENEPILALTILTTASRHMQLTGNGAKSRSPHVHQVLTEVLQRKLNRIIWGQKQFGGGFCKAGQSSKVKTLWEDLSTIESLMLLTEWHPRSLHFPPGDDDGELLVPLDPLQLMKGGLEGEVRVGAVEGRRVDSWLEPCWRSDRMCWVLLNLANTLAIESGIFEEHTTPADFKRNNPELSDDKVRQYFRRKNVLKELLPVYCATTSGRLELTSNLPNSFLKSLQDKADPVGRLNNRLRSLGITPDFNPNNTSFALKQLDSYPVDAVLHFWVEITLILDDGNNRIYKSRSHTRELVESGKYMDHLKYYTPRLQEWYRNFSACKAIPKHMRHILKIEYEYSRAFLYLLSLHAIVMRCSRAVPNASKMHNLAQAAVDQRNGRASGEGTPVPSSDFRHQDLQQFIGNDGPYVKEIAEACRNVFNIVINDLQPGGALKHCPVRTYFRIISAALILLKTFVVGGNEQEISTSLTLLDRACKALKASIVDDVHVGNRFAEMCDALARRIRGRFVRLAAMRTSHGSRAETPTRTETAGPQYSNGYAIPSVSNGTAHFDTSPSRNGQRMAGLDTHPNHWSNTLPVPQATDFNNPMAPGRSATPNPALWGIPNEIHDINNHNMSVLPPPTEYYMSNGMDGMGFDANFNGFDSAATPAGTGALDDNNWFDANGMPQQWLTVRMENLVGAGDVQSTQYGPTIGGEDLLDRLLYLQDPH